MESGHTFRKTFYELGHSTPVLFIALVSIMIVVMRLFCKSWMKKLGHSDVKEYNNEGFEDNPNFYDSIKKI